MYTCCCRTGGVAPPASTHEEREEKRGDKAPVGKKRGKESVVPLHRDGPPRAHLRVGHCWAATVAWGVSKRPASLQAGIDYVGCRNGGCCGCLPPLLTTPGSFPSNMTPSF